jgi:hypothetical protein
MPDRRTASFAPIRAALAALAALAAVASLAGAAGAQQPARVTKDAPGAPGQRVERQIICRGAAIPAGYLLVDNLKERSMCSGQSDAVYNSYNVWAVERYDNRAPGSEMTVCASAPTPAGWTVVDVFRKNDVCGQPTDPFAVNAKRIRRGR